MEIITRDKRDFDEDFSRDWVPQCNATFHNDPCFNNRECVHGKCVEDMASLAVCEQPPCFPMMSCECEPGWVGRYQ